MFTVGKYKGKNFEEVDPSYLLWYINKYNVEISKTLIKTLSDFSGNVTKVVKRRLILSHVAKTQGLDFDSYIFNYNSARVAIDYYNAIYEDGVLVKGYPSLNSVYEEFKGLELCSQLGTVGEAFASQPKLTFEGTYKSLAVMKDFNLFDIYIRQHRKTFEAIKDYYRNEFPDDTIYQLYLNSENLYGIPDVYIPSQKRLIDFKVCNVPTSVSEFKDSKIAKSWYVQLTLYKQLLEANGYEVKYMEIHNLKDSTRIYFNL
jgi:hypothetical protein